MAQLCSRSRAQSDTLPPVRWSRAALRLRVNVPPTRARWPASPQRPKLPYHVVPPPSSSAYPTQLVRGYNGHGEMGHPLAQHHQRLPIARHSHWPRHHPTSRTHSLHENEEQSIPTPDLRPSLQLIGLYEVEHSLKASAASAHQSLARGICLSQPRNPLSSSIPSTPIRCKPQTQAPQTKKHQNIESSLHSNPRTPAADWAISQGCRQSKVVDTLEPLLSSRLPPSIDKRATQLERVGMPRADFVEVQPSCFHNKFPRERPPIGCAGGGRGPARAEKGVASCKMAIIDASKKRQNKFWHFTWQETFPESDIRPNIGWAQMAWETMD
ncbi:hypothetical protein DFH27DRAFT_81247 [Peziza echinospora]|nr:hypothetical protein DFH27DRAFT_81247 [Peziza echinospora]